MITIAKVPGSYPHKKLPMKDIETTKQTREDRATQSMEAGRLSFAIMMMTYGLNHHITMKTGSQYI